MFYTETAKLRHFYGSTKYFREKKFTFCVNTTRETKASLSLSAILKKNIISLFHCGGGVRRWLAPDRGNVCRVSLLARCCHV